ncbi:MAG: hypothetical protein NT069_16825, partial [Planctomycetota bacterium]|nr:hypothetical protein [Planctomycetota bacterium]
SWTPGNQFATMRRWSLATANQTTTMWAALAIARWDNAGSKHSPTIQKAVAYLRRQPPNPENREWLATRLLLEHELGTTDEAARLRRQLLDARNPGGGWGWEAGVASDPLTTGLALYVLAKVGQNNDSEGVLDARRWPLASQENDGSWLTPSKNITNSTDRERLKARDEIYHYWGTAWAVIGLIETLPKSVP